VAAIDNENDRMIYVRPDYSYYEFQHPAAERLTDPLWMQLLMSNKAPPRPAWTSAFQSAKLRRAAGK
jgi:uncharacterized protein DUF3160